MIKAVFRTALRALQGFVRSLIESLGLDIACPHNSVFSRRAKDLRIPLRKLLKPGEKLNVVFDSTGVKVFGDGAYDTLDCREAVHGQGGKPIFPPDKNAKLQKGKPFPALRERDQAIRRIQELGDEGRSLWKQEIGYHRRSRVETFMFRYKTILGDRLAARKKWTQATEMAIKLDVLNRMTELGMPKSYKVAS